MLWGAFCRLRQLRISGINRLACEDLLPLGSPRPAPILVLSGFPFNIIQKLRLLGSVSMLMRNTHSPYSSTPVANVRSGSLYRSPVITVES
jgi:hypothetical protein